MIGRRILKNKQALLGFVIIILLLLVTLFAPLLAPNDPEAVNIVDKFKPSCSEYPLGTDELGRCILSRLIVGARYSLGIAIPIMLTVFCISLLVGSLSAYLGKAADRIVVILCDIVMAFPVIVIVLALVGALGQSLTNLFFSLLLALCAAYTKLVRSYVLQEKNRDYIAAAKVCESSNVKIIVKHIIPNIVPVLLVNFTIGIGEAIVMISGFSYLGLGVGAGVPEWGAMLSNAKQYFYSYPQFIIYPGLCILLCIVGFNLLGEALRDITSPEEQL